VAAACIGQALTSRGRNASVRILTGHDMQGFAEHDWHSLCRPGEVAAIYMAKKSARFIQGRLMMHGADITTPITLVQNVSRSDQRIIATCLGALADAVSTLTGPTVILYGLAPRQAVVALQSLKEARG
jgi:siroheme synthase